MTDSQQDSVTLRLATPAELGVVSALTDAAYERYVAPIGRKPQPMTTDYAPMIAQGQVWLLEVDGQPAGLIVLHDEEDRLLIYSVAVHPQFQKRGFGRRLLDFAEQQSARAGYSVVRLYTNAVMTENIALYGRVGYVEIGRESYPGGAIVHMEKEIQPHP